jgi:hypothetical protein
MKRVHPEISDVLVNVALLTEEDMSEYDRIRRELIKVLERLGGYEAAADDIFVDQIARNAIYSRKVEFFLDTPTANEHTYAAVTDTKLKLSKIVEKAMQQLALSRRDRLSNQSQANIMTELREALLRGLKNAGQ